MGPADTPVYHPDMKEKTGLFCFLNSERPCGPDCMAFQTTPMVKGPDYDQKQWAQCTVLVSLHQGGKHAAVMANTLIQLQRRIQTPGIPTVK